MVSLALVIDHVALDGMSAATLLNDIATILEGGLVP
jgi:pyruvate/2-oxoglutarate dehydrogenase complex dihydrolipoamide acyltransferase (E2) component